MAGVPINFQAVSNVLPTYQFIDFASGTGIVNFYLGTMWHSNVISYTLSNEEFYSDSYVLTAAFAGVSQKALDLDFDVLINRPLNLKGTTVVNVPLYLLAGGGGGCTGYVSVIIRKWNGVTETDLSANPEYSSGLVQGAGTSGYATKAIGVTIPLTHFKIGEYLRVTIEVYGSGNAGTVGIACDPMNRVTGWDATGAVPSKLVFQCPVRLNL